MSGIGLIVKSELKKHIGAIIKQMLFYIPVISIILMLSTTQNIKYQNQYEFLKGLGYDRIIKTDEIQENDKSFEVFKANVVTKEEWRGASVYNTNIRCEIFNLNNREYDFAGTYFEDENLCGYDLSKLNKGEILISYNAARRLEAKEGDKITIVSNTEGEDIDLIVKGIIKTKYPYENIGSMGLCIVDNEYISEWSQGNAIEDYALTFGDEEIEIKGTVFTREEEIEESNYLELPTQAVLMVNVVFPLFGLVLIFILVHRENRNVIAQRSKSIAILSSMGMSARAITVAFSSVYVIAYAISVIVALAIYKYGLIQGYVGEYVPMTTLVYSFVWCIVVGIAVFYFEARVNIKRIETMDVVYLLAEREIG